MCNGMGQLYPSYKGSDTLLTGEGVCNSSRFTWRKFITNNIKTSPAECNLAFNCRGNIRNGWHNNSRSRFKFLGTRSPAPNPSWGSMLNEGRQFLLIAPHLTIFPGLAIMVTVLWFNFLGDGIRDLMDVKR